jgi:hypothetical protein
MDNNLSGFTTGELLLELLKREMGGYVNNKLSPENYVSEIPTTKLLRDLVDEFIDQAVGPFKAQDVANYLFDKYIKEYKTSSISGYLCVRYQENVLRRVKDGVYEKMPNA